MCAVKKTAVRRRCIQAMAGFSICVRSVAVALLVGTSIEIACSSQEIDLFAASLGLRELADGGLPRAVQRRRHAVQR
jgi:hypothetical protein